MEILVKTFHGLEQILAQELQDLGAENIRPIKRGVRCSGNLGLLYSANYELRTALRVLTPIHSFEARNEKELYEKVREYDWSVLMDASQTFALDNSIFSDYFKHSKFAALKVKDAMVDQFRDQFKRRPSVDRENPEIKFDVHAWKEKFTISLDSSGESLHQRGYRNKGHLAPLNEVLAAGMVKLASWDSSIPLIDPMCGTGTLLIEAAMLACNIPPQWLRRDFSFKNWKDFSPLVWNRVKTEADSKIRRKPLQISGGDIDPKAVALAKKSIKQLGLQLQVRVNEVAFERHLPKTTSGMIITNPPYGERLEKKDILAFYKLISDLLKQHFQGFEAWVLSSNVEALKHLKLRPAKKLDLYNGALACKFQQYELYQGHRPE